ncbi:AP2 domain-containing protein [Mesobacillus persicus]|uniref:AP2 domain-containing protein n=1 Tax=Mesobacillus persicus TaxID=930146 RepID=A0A1H7XQ33_9BACI|nr:HNH endonuclease [Mesobacillus persicus]SEM36042.1 AP2 domain-containing protein [Mesobacillus persicus]
MENYKLIPLKGKRGEGLFVKVSPEDFEELMKHNWHYHNGYARGYIKGLNKNKRMHRYILDSPSGKFVDHINGNRLDNRRENLRYATHLQNNYNRQPNIGYKGVCYNNSNQKWYSYINKNKQTYFLGQYDSEIEAAKAYNYWAKIHYGEFAYLNDVDESEFVPKIKKEKTSKYRGVSWEKEAKKWRSILVVDGITYRLGKYKNEEAATRAYNQKAIELLGDKAKLNKINH